MSLRNEIENALARYALAYDDGDMEGVERVFGETAVFTMKIGDGDLIGPLNGREEIMGLFRGAHESQTDQRRHITTNLLIDEIDEKNVRTVSYLLITAADNGVLKTLSTGKYEDEWTRSGGDWVLTKRHIALDLPY
ncbi:nuclear transport factor 2 family protein [Prescottella equi]|uniref:nuclear transport factor 2 family protein n=1 Tax=Rhodococcus hoagii TaxID=43767 RepID=UPI0007CD5605|nr:nuclear transport factor 2 family protein [Prescottella equi]